jgi:hypothetical protein
MRGASRWFHYTEEASIVPKDVIFERKIKFEVSNEIIFVPSFIKHISTN